MDDVCVINGRTASVYPRHTHSAP
eukprot:COSAG04_NODE_31342_length_257_cov_0.658228_1_plen_23_part_10